MMDLGEAARAVGGRVRGEPVDFRGVQTDSRTIRPGDLFVALKGERFDGHEFVKASARRGAAAAMTSRVVELEPPVPQVLVDDTRLALGRLAADWRRRFDLPLVALTGSNGKTTVKEMVASILVVHVGRPNDLGTPGGTRDRVLATAGNLNNDIGMPLTLLGLRHSHRYAVIEMGMNHEGEIDYLTRIAAPTVALVNNAQRAHIGLLGSLEAIARAKGEIYAGLAAGGIALVNADEPHAAYWKSLNAGRRIVTFGFAPEADVRAVREGTGLRFATPAGAFPVTLQVAGEHNVRNALAACAVGHALGIDARAIQAGLAAFAGVSGRLQRRGAINGAVLIDDTYNANPESMMAAIQVLAAQAGRRILVMGDMAELGAAAGALHAEVGTHARASGIDALFALGAESGGAAQAFGPAGRHFPDTDALVAALRAEAGPAVTFLVKGSRFMQMEKVAEALAPGGSHAA